MSFSGPNSISSLCESRSAFGLYVQPIVVYGWFEQSNFLRSFSFIFRSSIQTEQGMPASYSLEALLESMIASIPRYNCFGNLGLIYLRFLIGTRRSDNYFFFSSRKSETKPIKLPHENACYIELYSTKV